MRRSAGGVIALCLAASTGHVSAQANSGDKGVVVVQRATRAYGALSSFQAQFQQRFEDKFVDMAPSKGTLYQEGKNHFAMRFSDPPKDAIVMDGTYTWIYTPSSTPGQVLRYPQPNHPTYGTNLLGTFLDDATDRYRITYINSEAVDGRITDVVKMELIAKDMPFRSATIWFDRELSLPRRLDIDESRDHRRIIDLTQPLLNRVIAPDVFVFKKPAGVRIVEQ